MTKMVSMKRDKEEIEEAKEMVLPPGGDEYPYGLRLCLCEEEMEKLGIDNLPAIGKEVTVTAKAKVVRVSSNATEGQEEEHMSLELQVIEMGIDGIGGKSAAATLYEDDHG
jgi:hypothetical protein